VEVRDRLLEKRAEKDEVCRRLMTVPGVGPITALSFFSCVEDPFRFGDNEAIGAYLGLAPRTRESGTMLQRRSISRMGDARTRKYLVSSAAKFAARCKEMPLGMWATRLRERRGLHPAHTALARKLAVIMLAIWKSGEDFSHSYKATRFEPTEPAEASV
jgi:transposase